MEEVGCPREGQEEDPGPSRRHSLPEGEGAEQVGNHWHLPCVEGGATDEARASPIHDGAWASFDGTALAEEALSPSKVAQRIKEAMEPSQDSAGTPLDFVYPVPGHPPMRPEPGYIVLVSFLFLMPSSLIELPTP